MPAAVKEAKSGEATAGDQPIAGTSNETITEEAAGTSKSTEPKSQTIRPKDANDDNEKADWPSAQLLDQAALAVAVMRTEISLRRAQDAIDIAALNWHYSRACILPDDEVKKLEEKLDENKAWYDKHAETAKRQGTAEEIDSVLQELIDDKFVETEQALAAAGGQFGEDRDQALGETNVPAEAAMASDSGSAAAHTDGDAVTGDGRAEEPDDDDLWAGGNDQLVYGPDGQPVRQG